jgi:hypothetical protein
MTIRFGENHKYAPPTNRELSEWGQKAFQLAAIVLSPDRESAQKITVKALNAWKTLLDGERQRAGKTRLYTSNPDEILFNRYHLLQARLFVNLQAQEIKQEAEVKKSLDETPDSIHSWTLVLRYVKYVLTRTNAVSELRLIGVCRILRDYYFKEITAFFDRLSPNREADGKGWHEEQYFKNNATRFFGDGSQNRERSELRLRSRFEFFAEVENPRSPTNPFRTLPGNHPVVGWIREHLTDLLSPWGADPRPSFNRLAGGEENPTPLDCLRSVTPKLINRAEKYCALDELRMLILTNPYYFEDFIRSLEKNDPTLKDTQPQELRLPIMKKSNDEEMPRTPPPVPLPWQIHEELEAMRAYQYSVDVRRQGWRAESLIVRVDDEPIAERNFLAAGSNGKKLIESTFPAATELVDVYLKSGEREAFFYQLLIDFDRLYEKQILEKNFTAEGGQTLTFRLTPHFQDGEIDKIQFTLEYGEPWHWKYLRSLRTWNAPRLTFNFPTLAVGGGAAAVLLLLGGLALTTFVNRQREIEPSLVSVEPAPEFTVNGSPPANASEEKNVKEELPPERTDKNYQTEKSETPKRKNFKEKTNEEGREKSSEKSGRQQKEATPVKKSTTDENPERLANQIRELRAISNAARGGTKIAQQETGFNQNSQNPSEGVLALTLLDEGPEFENDIDLPGVKKNTISLNVRNGNLGSSPLWDYSNQNGEYINLPDKVYVKSNRITFKWREIPGAVKYSFRVGAQGNNLIVKPIYDKTVTETQITETFDLSPDQTYIWQARAIDREGRARPQRVTGTFKTLPIAAAKRVESAEKKYADSPLRLGVMYMKNGLLDEAVKLFEKYAAENPNSTSVKILLERAEQLRSGKPAAN